MTSGVFSRAPVADIRIDRENRQRRELEGIEELAASIERVGLINPIVIDRTMTLVAGERRLTAVKSLGWVDIPFQYTDELDPNELAIIELEENIKRHQLSWQDECRAIKRYHESQVERDPTWTNTATAAALNSDLSVISRKLMVAQEIEAGNARVLDAPKLSTAINVTQRTIERKAEATLAAVETITKGVAPAKPKVPLLHEDFHEWAPAYTGVPFNFIHCDFPYGVNADKHDQGQAALAGGYEDTFEVYTQCLDTLTIAMDGVVAPNAHLMFWFSLDYYQFTFDRLTAMGWRVNPFPLIWMKDDNTGILPDANRGPRRIYETAFFASRGDRKIVSAVSNAKAWPGKDKSIHMSEKPVGMLTHFFRMIVDDTTRMLDPTAGSANSLKAAQALNASVVLGLERDAEFFQRAVEAYFDGTVNDS